MRIDVRTVGPFQENCYLVVDEGSGRAILVDPGDEADVLLDMVRTSGATLDAIWLTHAHIDHIGGIEGVRRAYPVPVHLHPLDLPYYERLSTKAAEMYGVQYEPPTAPVSPLADGDVLSCGALRFDVMHVPGHSPGHVSFLSGDVALSGDLLFAGSIGRTDLPLANPFDMDSSLDRFGALAPGIVVHPGHGPTTTIGGERASNPFLAGRARTLKR